MRPVVVFDTNILISAIGWRGAPYHCLELVRTGAVDGISCPEILDELEDKLRSKLHFVEDVIVEMMTDLLGVFRLVPITSTLHVVAADPDDDKVVKCAVVAGATHIVTGDRRHLLPMGSYQGIAIVSAADLLALVTASQDP